MSEVWKSDRRLAEEAQAAKFKAFNALVDMALDGQITMVEAEEAFNFNAELYVIKKESAPSQSADS